MSISISVQGGQELPELPRADFKALMQKTRKITRENVKENLGEEFVYPIFEADNFILYGKASIEQRDKQGQRILMDALDDALHRFMESDEAPGVISRGHDDVIVGVPLWEWEVDEGRQVDLGNDQITIQPGEKVRTEIQGDTLWLVCNLAKDTQKARESRLRALMGDLDGYSVTVFTTEEEIKNGERTSKEVDFHAVTLGTDKQVVNPGTNFGVVDYKGNFGKLVDPLKNLLIGEPDQKEGFVDFADERTFVPDELDNNRRETNKLVRSLLKGQEDKDSAIRKLSNKTGADRDEIEGMLDALGSEIFKWDIDQKQETNKFKKAFKKFTPDMKQETDQEKLEKALDWLETNSKDVPRDKLREARRDLQSGSFRKARLLVNAYGDSRMPDELRQLRNTSIPIGTVPESELDDVFQKQFEQIPADSGRSYVDELRKVTAVPRDIDEQKVNEAIGLWVAGARSDRYLEDTLKEEFGNHPRTEDRINQIKRTLQTDLMERHGIGNKLSKKLHEVHQKQRGNLALPDKVDPEDVDIQGGEVWIPHPLGSQDMRDFITEMSYDSGHVPTSLANLSHEKRMGITETLTRATMSQARDPDRDELTQKVQDIASAPRGDVRKFIDWVVEDAINMFAV